MNILIIGFGSIGQRHFNNLKTLGFHPEIYSHHLHQTKPSRKSYDLILICSRTADHLQDIKKFKKLSQNFFIEKPVAASVAQAQAIKKILKNKKVMLGYVLIFHPLIKKIRSLLNRKKLGDVFLAQLHAGYYLPYWRQTDYCQSYSASKAQGGGVSLDLIHEINYAQFLFPQSISKIIGAASHISDLKITSDDVAFFGLVQKDKYINISLNYLDRRLQRYILIFGTKGKLICDLASKSLSIINNDGQKVISEKINLDMNNLYLDELKSFITAIKNKLAISPIISLNQGVKDVKIVSYVS